MRVTFKPGPGVAGGGSGVFLQLRGRGRDLQPGVVSAPGLRLPGAGSACPVRLGGSHWRRALGHGPLPRTPFLRCTVTAALTNPRSLLQLAPAMGTHVSPANPPAGEGAAVVPGERRLGQLMA